MINQLLSAFPNKDLIGNDRNIEDHIPRKGKRSWTRLESTVDCCSSSKKTVGKSHVYKEISPNSILISGGHTTVANLFYNLARRTVGLVGLWDVVAFDEVAGINFKSADTDSIDEAYKELKDDEITWEEIQLMRLKFLSDYAN